MKPNESPPISPTSEGIHKIQSKESFEDRGYHAYMFQGCRAGGTTKPLTNKQQTPTTWGCVNETSNSCLPPIQHLKRTSLHFCSSISQKRCHYPGVTTGVITSSNTLLKWSPAFEGIGRMSKQRRCRSRECDKSATKPHFQNQAPNKSDLHWILFALLQFSITFILSHKKGVASGVAQRHLIPLYCSTQKPFLTLSFCRKQNSVTDEILSNYIITSRNFATS